VSWLRTNWPPFSSQWDLPFGTLTDLIGIGLAGIVLGLTIWVARRQLRIMATQVEMMKEQNEASERIEAITRRQGEIAEAQHRIFMEQSSRQPVLEMGEGNVLIVPEKGFERVDSLRKLRDQAIQLTR